MTTAADDDGLHVDTGTSTMDAPIVPTRGFLYYEDARVGDTCWTPALAVTGEMIDAYARVSGDHNQVHVDEEYARASIFGARVAHGLLGAAVADGLKSQSEYRFHPGASLGWTVDFLAPIFIDDVVKLKFWVASARISRSRPGWGVVVLPCELHNQNGVVVMRGEHRLMVPRRPLPG
jgi:acyl dehydratase